VSSITVGLTPAVQALLAEKERRVAEDSERERREAARAAESKRKEEREAAQLEDRRRRALIEQEYQRMPLRKQLIAQDLAREQKCTPADRAAYTQALRTLWAKVGQEARALSASATTAASPTASTAGFSGDSGSGSSGGHGHARGDSSTAATLASLRGIVALGPVEFDQLARLQAQYHISRERNQRILHHCGLPLEAQRAAQMHAAAAAAAAALGNSSNHSSSHALHAHMLPPLHQQQSLSLHNSSASSYIDAEPQCVSCLLQPALLMTRECGHLAYCDRCAGSLLRLPPHIRSCIVCRTPVSSLVPTLYGVPQLLQQASSPAEEEAATEQEQQQWREAATAATAGSSAQPHSHHSSRHGSLTLPAKQRPLWLHTEGGSLAHVGSSSSSSQEEKQQQPHVPLSSSPVPPGSGRPRPTARVSSIAHMHWA